MALDGLAVQRVVGDVLDPASLQSAMQGVEWVFHAAARAAHWREGKALVETTVVGTRNVLAAAQAAGVRRVVFTSSLAALGVPKPGELLDENHQFNYPPGRWPYGYAKYLAEQEALAAEANGLDCVIINPASVFGPGDLNLISGALVIELARRRVPATTGGGMNVVHVADVVTGHLAGASRGRSGQRYIIGGENLPHSEIVRRIAAEVGVRPPRFQLPAPAVRLVATTVDFISPLVRLPYNGDFFRLSNYRFYCDTSKARRELGLPEPLPSTQAIREAVAWYREHGYLQ